MGADLVCTGEVVGQDPMSQRKEWLLRAAREAGLPSRVLRPLSARHLPETDAERSGTIDRAQLGSAHGRRREVQAALAARFGGGEVPVAAGGCCRLPERAFAARLRDLLAHRALDTIGADDLEVLHFGRHFRLGPSLKAVVARNEEEGRKLEALSTERFSACVGNGAVVWLDGEPDGEAGERAASLAARYGRRGDGPETEVVFRRGADSRSIPPGPPVGTWLDACRVL